MKSDSFRVVVLVLYRNFTDRWAAFAGTVTEPSGVVGATAAVVATPAGSETFAGSSDAFLLRIQP